MHLVEKNLVGIKTIDNVNKQTNEQKVELTDVEEILVKKKNSNNITVEILNKSKLYLSLRNHFQQFKILSLRITNSQKHI